MTKRQHRARARWYLAKAIWELGLSDLPKSMLHKAGDELADWWNRLSPLKRKRSKRK